VEISEKLYEELSKLSKSEWDKLKINIDFLYGIELKKKESTLYLSSDTVKDGFKFCPVPIRLRSE
jgi:hypothetical protein